MFTVTKNFGRSFSPVTLVLEPFFRCSQARPAGAIGDALRCPGFNGQLISRQFDRFVLHGSLIIQ